VSSYIVTFDRIGRSHDVKPLHCHGIDGPNHLAEAVYHYARPHLLSRDVDVVVDLGAMRGSIFCGVQSGGSFEIGEVGS